MDIPKHHIAYLKAACTGYRSTLQLHGVPADTVDAASANYTARLLKRASNRAKAQTCVKYANLCCYIKNQITPNLKTA